MYKTVVFDLDGTLLNTLTDLADAGNRLCRKYAWPTHERQAYRYFVGNGIPKLVERLAPADQRTPAVGGPRPGGVFGGARARPAPYRAAMMLRLRCHEGLRGVGDTDSYRRGGFHIRPWECAAAQAAREG